MQCCATENLVKEDFTLHRSSTKRCTESMKDKFLTSVIFGFSYNSDLKESTNNAISQTSLIEISKGTNKFSKHSGLKPNKSKCQKLQE